MSDWDLRYEPHHSGSTILKLVDPSVLVGLALYLSLIPILLWLPYQFPPDRNVASVAAAVGYNNQVAYLVVVVWVLIAVSAALWLAQPKSNTARSVAAQPRAPVTHGAWFTRRSAVEVVLVSLVFLALYFPPFLARYGPYVEDNWFLTPLHRMQAGQQPYVDFEFPYGPAIIYPVHYWMNLFGYSLTSYYAFLALLEVVQFAVLLVVLQREFPQFRQRLAVFALFALLLFDTLLGLNYNGVRRLLPALIIILLIDRPLARGRSLIASVFLSILLAYSHEFGLATAAGVLVMYAFEALNRRQPIYLVHAAFILTLSVCGWIVLVVLFLGPAWTAYFSATLVVLSRFNAGEQGFAFGWTLNSLSIFALLGISAFMIGRGLRGFKTMSTSAGDRLLLAGLAYTVVALKGGLNRADLWHLTAPMLVLVFAYVLPRPRALFAASPQLSRVVLGLLVIMATTYFAGLMSTASLYLSGLVRGAEDVLGGVPNGLSNTVHLRGPTVEAERSHPITAAVNLGAYLADPSRLQRPVIYYGEYWNYDKRVGAYQSTYPVDGFLSSDDVGNGVKEFAAENRPFVIIQEAAYRRLLDSRDPSWEAVNPDSTTPAKRILSWLSSVHYREVEIEWKIKERRWARTLGYYVIEHYQETARFGDLVLLDWKVAE